MAADWDGQGRDPAADGYSLMTGCIVGSTTAEFEARLRRHADRDGDGRPLAEIRADLSETWVLGAPEEAADRLGDLAGAGVEAVMLQHLAPDDLEMLDVVADEIRPRL